jgi:tetratricopeptide (TPR) repeat protein
LELPGVDDPDVDVLGLVTAWLNNEQNNGSWLMILDNFDDTHVLFNATSHVAVKKKIQHGRSSSGTATFEAMPRILAKYIPQTDRGRILITTRDRFAAFKLVGDHGRIVDIPTMNELEALELLHSKLPEHKGNDPDCKELVKEMDYLPLAVTQASAYIGVNAQMTVSKYLFMFRKDSSKQARLLERDSGDLRRDIDVPNAVIKTWELSFSQIEGRKPGAIELLSLLSFLDCQGTPEFLLLDEEDDELDLQDNIGMLTAYSLIFVAKGGLAYGMHRLVQIATRRWLETHDKMNVWKFEALKKVAKLFPSGNFETWKECQMALPQVKIVTDYKNISNEAEIYRANLLYKTSHYYEEQALWGSALEGFEEALKVRELVLGAEHPDTLTVVHSLGWAFHSMSKKQTAEELTRRALVARQAALGKQHPDTLNTLNNLAFMIDDEDMAKEALDGRRQSLGEHAETAESLHNVSIILLNKGKIDEALQLNTEALALMEKLYGQEHPTTLTALFIRSGILVDIGDNDGAEEVALRCLEIREAKLGPTHIDSIVSLEDCASVYNAKRDFVKAEDFIRRAIKLYEEHPEKGPSHSNTLLSLSFLGRYLSQQKKFDEAEEIFRLALDRVIAKFGPEHDETLLCQGDLGLMYLRQKKPDQAMTILEPLMKAGRGMKIRNQSVLDITYTIAEKFYRQNKLEEDLVLRKALVDGHTHVAGPMDPATLNAMNGLGMALQRAGHDTEAEEVHLKTWTSRVEVLGPENRQTLSSSRKLVMLLKKRGAKDEAEEQLRREREVSSTTPEQTIVRYESLHCIAREKHRRMKLDDAETLVREVLKWRRENLKSEDLTTLQSVHLLGMTLEDMETPEADAEAELCYREAYEKRLNLIGAEDDRTVAALRGLVCVLGYQKKDAEMTELKKLLPKRKKKKKKKDTGTEKTNTGGNVENEGGKETETTEEAKESEDSEGSEDSDGTDETDSEMEVNDEENEAKKEETEAKEDESAAKKAQSEVNEDGNEAINDEEEAKKDDNEPTDAR